VTSKTPLPPPAQPFAENPFRVLTLTPTASPYEVMRAADQLATKLAQGKEVPAMLAMGPVQRTPELCRDAGLRLSSPSAAAGAAALMPWLESLPLNRSAVTNALDALTLQLRQAAPPAELVAPLVWRLLPPPVPDHGPAEALPGYVFPGDVDLDDALGPPPPPPPEKGQVERDFRKSLEQVPQAVSGAVSEAILGVSRAAGGRRLHGAYLKGLLAAADAFDAGAQRKLTESDALFQEVRGEPGSALLTPWRDLVEGRLVAARAGLAAATREGPLPVGDRDRHAALQARLQGLTDPEAALRTLEGHDGPEVAAVRGALWLHAGDVEPAQAALKSAWASAELRPRIAALLALCHLESDALDEAEEALKLAPEGQPNTVLAQARLAHARGDRAAALRLYRESMSVEPGPSGACWGLCATSDDPKERKAARVRLAEAVEGTPFAAPLAEQALTDGERIEAEGWLGRLGEDDDGVAARVKLLDFLGQRDQAWVRRREPEGQVRDRGRALLAAGRPREALAALAGLPYADPLRRRAVQGALWESIAQRPHLPPEGHIERVLGQVWPAELALLDLPTALLGAVRAVEEDRLDEAKLQLRRHLDSGDHAEAEALLGVLAPGSSGYARLGALLGLWAKQPGATLPALLGLGEALEAELWEAAVIASGALGLEAEVGEFEGGSAELGFGAGLLRSRQALARGDAGTLTLALEGLRQSQTAPIAECEEALGHAIASQLDQRTHVSPGAAFEAVQRAPGDTQELLHDRAVWLHAALASAPQRPVERLIQVAQAWEKARAADALAHPSHPDREAAELAIAEALAALLLAVPPIDLEPVKRALAALDSPLLRRAQARAWG
jgi:tetratricopeptide (TPR) repeat protein